MKNNYLTLLFLFSVCFGFAQTKDSLSVEEQARREKNIQAGNPFKKFGYTPKIATLSKGKYLEFHDLDSIVKIGSFSFHVKKKSVTGYTRLEQQNSEAGLSPEIISRWMSPDPLSEEFPSWSPYNFTMNSPINLIDPDGRASLDWKPDNNGNLIAEKGDNTATLATYLNKDVNEVGKNFKVNGESIGTDYQFKEGQRAKPDNNITQAISNSKGITMGEALSGTSKQISPSTDNYNCDQCAQMATNGEQITPANGAKYSQFPNPVSNNPTPGFSQVDSFANIPFNQGIASIGGQHTVSYYGSSNDGTTYVFSKDGNLHKPQVYSLQQTITLYNKVQGTNFTMKDVTYYKKDGN